MVEAAHNSASRLRLSFRCGIFSCNMVEPAACIQITNQKSYDLIT